MTSKKYNITHQKGSYVAMRDVMAKLTYTLDKYLHSAIFKSTKTIRSVSFGAHGGFLII